MTRTKIPIDNRPPFRRRFRPTTLRRLSARPSRHIRVHTRATPSFNGLRRAVRILRGLSPAPRSEKFVTKCLTPRFPPRRREVTACGGTPRHCDVTPNRVLHPYKPRSLRYRTAARFACAQSPGSRSAFRVSPSCKAPLRRRAVSATAVRPRACALKIRTRIRDFSFR